MIRYDGEYVYYDVLPRNIQNGKSRKPIECRLVENEYVEGYCHEVLRNKDKDGYVTVAINKVTKRLHRYMYKNFKQDIPDNIVVRHLCNNTSCINLDHMTHGTYQDNSDDMTKSNRHVYQKGSSNNCSVLNERDVYEIKHLLKHKTMTFQLISEHYGVSRSTINNIAYGNQWTHVII